MPDIVKIYRQSFKAMRFIGKKYGNCLYVKWQFIS